MKSYANWKGSMYDYLTPGDVVDEAMYDYFNECLPPVHSSSHLIQMGEPYDSVNGRNTYATLEKVEGDWIYRGRCHRKETIEVLR